MAGRHRRARHLATPAARRFARELILEYLRAVPRPLLARGRGRVPAARAAYVGFVNWIDSAGAGPRADAARLARRAVAAARLRRDVVVEWWADHAGPTPRPAARPGPPRAERGLVADLLRTAGRSATCRPSVRVAYERLAGRTCSAGWRSTRRRPPTRLQACRRAPRPRARLGAARLERRPGRRDRRRRPPAASRRGCGCWPRRPGTRRRPRRRTPGSCALWNRVRP